MRTTLILDDDLAVQIDRERRRTGETFPEAVNRLLRRGLQRQARKVELPVLRGRPRIEVTDVSSVLAEDDDAHLRDPGGF